VCELEFQGIEFTLNFEDFLNSFRTIWFGRLIFKIILASQSMQGKTDQQILIDILSHITQSLDPQ
jgi:hypothetical protein